MVISPISISRDDIMSEGITCPTKSASVLAGGSNAASMLSTDAAEGPMCLRGKVSSPLKGLCGSSSVMGLKAVGVVEKTRRVRVRCRSALGRGRAAFAAEHAARRAAMGIVGFAQAGSFCPVCNMSAKVPVLGSRKGGCY